MINARCPAGRRSMVSIGSHKEPAALLPTCRDMSEPVTDYLEQATPLRTRAAI
jgi:hypothetical protein